MVKAIIFDLDNCIFDTSSMGGKAIQEVKDILKAAPLAEETKDAVRLGLKTDALEDVLARLSVPQDTAEAMRAAYRESDVPAGCVVRTYGDEQIIRTWNVLKVLVTSGYKKFQTAKITRLGIADMFDEVIIDTLDDPAARKGKLKIFEEILAKHNVSKDEVLVAGDNPRSELGVAKQLGITAVQTLRPGVVPWSEADYRITDLSEITPLLK